MQLIVVNETEGTQHRQLMESMLRLRARVFAGRLNWQVDSHGGLERDRFDDQGPTYIVGVEDSFDVVGCVRLLPPMRSSMLTEVFPHLLDGHSLQMHERMIESSRFCIDRDPPNQTAPTGGQTANTAGVGRREGREDTSIIQSRTRVLLAGIVEWSLACGYDELVTATDLRFERLLKMVGWPLRRLGSPRMINETHSVAGSLEISADVFQSLKPEGYRSLFDQTARAG
jgi:N-acyl-L-homoserine lactone synthetase